MIFDEFGIFLPAQPRKSDFGARFFYYLELCNSLNAYWSDLGFDPIHLPVFLYGFAPEIIRDKMFRVDLSKPKRAWFIGGGINNNGDFDYLDQINTASQSTWQGNKETEVGDIIVMYCLTPRSYVHSIWRAIQPGSTDPFDCYHGKIWIGHPRLLTKPLTLDKIKADPELSQMSLIKGNMQGINGRQIQKRFYDRILDLLKISGENIDDLPHLEDIEQTTFPLKNERDVEIYILEPLLKQLDFNPSDWERQVKLRVGRSEKVIPDYLLFPIKNPAMKSVSANWVWEAKHTILSHEQLQNDFGQASSYGRLVGATGVGLVSKEGIWIGLKRDDYDLKKIKHWSAHQLLQADHLNEIRSLASKKQIRNT
jgi:hypothetical protein